MNISTVFNNSKILILILISFFYTFTTVNADTLSLKTGEKLQGILYKLSDSRFEFKSQYGKTIILPNSSIKHFKSESFCLLQLKSSERINGFIEINEENKLILDSPLLGKLSIPLSKLTYLIKNSAKDRRKTASKKKEEEIKQIGKKKKSPPKDFLRGSTVILKKGEKELYLSSKYKRIRKDYSFGGIFPDQRSNETIYSFSNSIGITFGALNNLELWAELPFVYKKYQRASGDVSWESKSRSNIGDMATGFRYLLKNETISSPSITTSLTIVAPTGKHPYTENRFKSNTATGSGFWRFVSGLNFTSSYDPAILFSGLDIAYTRPEKLGGVDYAPGLSIGYNVCQVPLTLNDYHFSPNISFGLSDEATEYELGLKIGFDF